MGESKNEIKKTGTWRQKPRRKQVEAVRKQKGMKQKELLAQLQVNGVDMNASGLSKLEGQIRFVTDVELVALADILEVSVDYLLGREN